MIGRNEPCWCGSGKKYKKCHMHSDAQSGERNADSKLHARQKKMIKSAEEIEGMRRAGAFNGELMDYIRSHVKPGISTAEIDRLVYEYTCDHGHTPACLGYHGFPCSVCTSINDVVCHGIPSEKEVLKEGDIVNIDLTTIVDECHGDQSETFLIEPVSDEARLVVRTAARALIAAIKALTPGEPLDIVGRTIEPLVNDAGCSVVRQYTGHGIGKQFHEHFTVYHHMEPSSKRLVLLPGMTFTIEPMINLGGYKVYTDSRDKWTVRTKDNSLSAQFEHTLLITEREVEILTRTPSQKNLRVDEFYAELFT